MSDLATIRDMFFDADRNAMEWTDEFTRGFEMLVQGFCGFQRFYGEELSSKVELFVLAKNCLQC